LLSAFYFIIFNNNIDQQNKNENKTDIVTAAIEHIRGC